MRKDTLANGQDVRLPDALDEISIYAWNRFQFYATQATAMGNDMEKVRQGFSLFFQFQKSGKYDEAANWVQNAYHSLYCNASMHNPLQMAYAVLAVSQEESSAQAFSESRLKERLEKLSEAGLSQKQVEDSVFFFLRTLGRN